MDNAAIEAIGLAIKKDKKIIINELSFSCRKGKIIGLIGPSGSGKTTLMRTIIGVQKNSSGSLSVLGEAAGGSMLRQKIGYVTQQPSVYLDLTVEQNLQYFAAIVGASKENIQKVVEAVELQKQRRQLAGSLSGGQLARVSLTVALLGDPELLVLDEPTVGLDPILRNQLWELFAKLAGQGKTLIVSSHVMDEAERCDDILLLRDGMLLWQDSKQELLAHTKKQSIGEAFVAIINEGGR